MPVVDSRWSSIINGVEEIIYKSDGGSHYVRFRKGIRLIFVKFDGTIQDRDETW